MTELDEDISVDSDEDDDSDSMAEKGSMQHAGKERKFTTDAERRAHHNALERKRRDQIKECFIFLRDKLPNMKSEKQSRNQILRKAKEYIFTMEQKRQTQKQEIAQLKRKIREIEQEEKRINAGRYSPEVNVESNSASDSADERE